MLPVALPQIFCLEGLSAIDAVSSTGTGESNATEQLRLANLLQQLGCYHVLQTYWESSTAFQRSGERQNSFSM